MECLNLKPCPDGNLRFCDECFSFHSFFFFLVHHIHLSYCATDDLGSGAGVRYWVFARVNARGTQTVTVQTLRYQERLTAAQKEGFAVQCFVCLLWRRSLTFSVLHKVNIRNKAFQQRKRSVIH